MLPDDGMDEIEIALEELLEKGFIEIAGINEDGQWLYRATEKGVDFYNQAVISGLRELFNETGDDVE